jgi:hypothetical protein
LPEHDRDGHGAGLPRPAYDELLYKFLEHFLWIASGMNRPGQDGMWDEQDGFYYDLLRLPTGGPCGFGSAPWWVFCPCAP